MAALVVVLVAALFSVTTVLNSWYHADRAARAGAHRDAGRAHIAQGELELGVEEYRAALLLERDDVDSERA